MEETVTGVTPGRARLCVALLVLLGFVLGCSEFIVIGIESNLAEEMGVSLATAGQLISLFALPYAVMTPVLALATGRFRRYSVMLAYLVIFALATCSRRSRQSLPCCLRRACCWARSLVRCWRLA